MIVKYFSSRKEALDILKQDPEEWEMSIRNTMYGKILGFYDKDELVACMAFSIYDDEMHIYTFEVADSLKGNGYGKKCYSIVLDMFRERINRITLDYLDADAETFWRHMGFVEDPNGESDDAMILELN